MPTVFFILEIIKCTIFTLLIYDIVQYIKYSKRVQKINTSPGPATAQSTQLNLKDHRLYVTRLLHDETSVVDNIRGMFHGAPICEIPRDAVLAALQFYISMEESTKDVAIIELASESLTRWEKATPELSNLSRAHWDGGVDYYNRPKVDFIRIGQTDVTPAFKPFIVRCVIRVVRYFTVQSKLTKNGFIREIYSPSGVTFWTKYENNIQPPLYLFHGFGFGSAPFIPIFLTAFVERYPKRTIVICEWPNLGHGVFQQNYPNTTMLASALHEHLNNAWEKMLSNNITECNPLNNGEKRQHSIKRVADVVGHSYGTSVIAYWNREYKNDLRKKVSIDPMSIGLTFGIMLGYGQETRLQSWKSMWNESKDIMSFVLEYMVKCDIDTQIFLKRDIWLFEMWETKTNEWNETQMLVLSEKDEYVNSNGIVKMFKAWKFTSNILLVPDWMHGGCCLEKDNHGVWEKIADFVK